jgi:carboxypeptidase C (cathepsin A)
MTLVFVGPVTTGSSRAVTTASAASGSEELASADREVVAG